MSEAVQIHIPEPCHENWQNMMPKEQGRFCGSCQKTVVDFSAMNDKEILDYISKASHHLCGRFSNDQLNREIMAAENKKRFSWAYIWNVLLATFLFTESYAQGKPAIKNKPVTTRKPVAKKNPAAQPRDMPAVVGAILFVKPKELEPPPPREISGVVLDRTTNEPIPGASVYFKYEINTGITTDALGNFHLSVNNKDSVTLTISSVGYDNQMLVLDNKSNWQDIKVYLNRAFRDVVMLGGISVKHKIARKEKVKRTVNNWVPASLKKDIKIYPNPVVRGNAIQVNVSLKETGSYKLELMDVQGRVVEVQKLEMTTKERQVTIPTQTDWSVGIYWIRITAPGIKNVYQAKVAIQ